MILALILPLILIPKIQSKAAAYSLNDFVYQYNGYNYAFYVASNFPVSTDLPENYSFDSSVIEEVISYTGKGLNLNFASYQGYFFNFDLSQSLGNQIFAFVQNAIVAIGEARQDLGNTSASSYSWDFTYTGSDPDYPGHDLYGTAYGFRFSGLTWETVDLVLDATGHLYGSQVLGNFTSSETTEDVMIWSIHQHDGDENWWTPENSVSSYQNLLAPYIQGDSLIFYLYYGGDPYKFELKDFANTYIGVHWSGINQPVIYFYNASKSAISQYTLVNHDNYPNVNFYLESPRFYLDSDRAIRPCALLNFNNGGSSYPTDFILPNYYSQGSTLYMSTAITLNSLGYYNSVNISGSYNRIFLSKTELTPDPDPPDLPVGDPINLIDLPDDPIEYEPTEDPEPVPGIDYPTPDPGPGPTPTPTPPLPPLVSGNDDLWPDMNGVFEVESEIDGFLGGLSNFEFTPLRTLVEGFSSSLIWVSTIMMALYNGSDFSILFVVLSIFFIAAALLGIYKWWTH